MPAKKSTAKTKPNEVKANLDPVGKKIEATNAEATAKETTAPAPKKVAAPSKPVLARKAASRTRAKKQAEEIAAIEKHVRAIDAQEQYYASASERVMHVLFDVAVLDVDSRFAAINKLHDAGALKEINESVKH
jgi:hypothetical protein